MAEKLQFNRKIMVFAVSAIIILGFSVWIHSYGSQNSKSDNSLSNASNQNITTYLLDGYCLTFNGGNNVSLLSGQFSLGFHFSVFTLNSNKFLQEIPVSYHVIRIDGNVQNTVGVIDNYSGGSVTYIFTPFNGLGIDYVIPPVTGMYILFNISFGQASFIRSGTFVYSHNCSNLPEFGHYLVSNSYSAYGIQFFDSYQNNGALSWQQIQAQNLIVYEMITVAPGGDYMDLLTGPYNSNTQATWSYTGMCISSGGVPQT